MSLTIHNNTTSQSDDTLQQKQRVTLRTLLFSWEIYLIVAVAAFLRLYGINTTEFDGDQADIFHMAYSAVSHAHLVATSNIASIGIYNPPGIIYFLMLPAAFSADPVGGAIFTSLLAILSVLLTYLFTRRYYGRLAATFVALIYATAFVPIFYSRFIWNQNLLIFFVPLLIWVLFRGVVDRRTGWFGWAIFLVGLLFQFHGSGLILAAPVVMALLLAPWKTLRWRDLALGIFLLLVIYSPYIIWEIASHYRDVHYLLTSNPSSKTLIDKQALVYYRHFLSPYDQPFTNTRSVIYPFLWAFNWLTIAMVTLAGCGLLLLAWLVSGIGKRTDGNSAAGNLWKRATGWWSALRASPERSGMLILLVWQVVPLIALTRHSLELFPHYFIILMPGLYLLVGLFLAQAVHWLQKRDRWATTGRFLVAGLAALIIVAQFLASTGIVWDTVYGNFSDRAPINPNPYYANDLVSLQRAAAEADQQAQQHHFNRVYISIDAATGSAFTYLATQMHTPTTVVDKAVMVLPDPAAGPAILLVPPYSTFVEDFASRYVHTTLLTSTSHLGGPPFRIYSIDPVALSTPTTTLSNDLQYLDAQAVDIHHDQWLITHWRFLHSAPAIDQTSYVYQVSNELKNSPDISGMYVFNSIRAGDEFLLRAKIPGGHSDALKVKLSFFTSIPHVITLKGPFPIKFDTYERISSREQQLYSTQGNPIVTIPIQ